VPLWLIVLKARTKHIIFDDVRFVVGEAPRGFYRTNPLG
jgi:hypothetical protein